MHLFLKTRVKEDRGSDVVINCLWCNRQGVSAHTRQRTEWLKLFHFIPIARFRTVFVKCSACGKDMIAKCSLEEVVNSNPLTLKYLLVKRVSFVGKVCIALAVLLCWAPLIGLIPSVIGFLYRNEFQNWVRKMSLVVLIISILSTLAGIAGLLLSPEEF